MKPLLPLKWGKREEKRRRKLKQAFEKEKEEKYSETKITNSKDEGRNDKTHKDAFGAQIKKGGRSSST